MNTQDIAFALERPNRWNSPVLKLNFLRDNLADSYDGRVIELSLRGGSGVFEFAIRSSALFRTKLRLSIIGHSGDRCVVEVSEQTVADEHIRGPSENSQLRVLDLEAEITAQALGSKTATGRVIVVPCGTHNNAYILAGRRSDPNQLHTATIQDRQFTAANAARFALIWLSLFLALLVASAHLPIVAKNAVQLKFLVTALSWGILISGLPEVAHLPVRRWVRSAVGHVRESQGRGWFVLGILTISLILPNLMIGYCVSHRIYYQRLIEKYLDSRDISYLRDAMAHSPWRLEARYLFERRTAGERVVGTDALHDLVNEFISDESKDFDAALAAVRNSGGHICLQANTRALTSPAVWYASVLPEAEAHNETAKKRRAVNLLTGHHQMDAKIQRLLLEISIVAIELRKTTASEKRVVKTQGSNNVIDAKLATLAVTLEQLILSRPESVSRSEVAQIAADRVAQTTIENGCNIEKGVRWFERILEARELHLNSNELRWLRPPDKLALFHVFLYLSGEKDIEAQFARAFLASCDGRTKMEFENRIFRRKQNEVFQNRAAWRSNTPLGRPPEGFVTHQSFVKDALLHENWRY